MHSNEGYSAPRVSGLGFLLAIALFELPVTLLAGPDSNPDAPESVAPLKKLGAEFELDEQGRVRSVSFGAGRIVTDASLVHLCGLESISRLKLDGTQVTDQGLKHLKNLRHLTWLRLADTQQFRFGSSGLWALTAGDRRLTLT